MDPILEAADLHEYAATGRSFVDDAGDFVIKGVPLAVASGLYSMYNTGVSLGNTLGGDFEKKDLKEDLLSYDDDLAKYYTEHKEGIDLGGFMATSFLPGAAGIKALKVLQSGALGANAARATNLFNNIEREALRRANSTIQAETNQVFKLLDSNKLTAIAAGYGEQALQAATFETATLLTMNQSPVINKEDQSYLQSLVYHTPDLVKNALLGGAIGGSIHAIGISGKLKKMIRERDADDFPSLRIPEIGLSDIDSGTKAGIDFTWLRQREADFESKATRGELNDRQLRNYRTSQKQKETELRLRIKDELAGGDAELGNQVWEHLNGLKDEGSGTQLARSAEDIATTILGAAKGISRVSEEDLPGGVTKVISEGGILSERHTKKILERNKIAPGAFDSMDEVTAKELEVAGFDMYKDSAGNLRVIPGIKYAQQFSRTISKKEHELIIKLAGDQAGNITEHAYPAIGDIGKLELDKKGNLLVGGQVRAVPKWNPLENDPLDSNAAFTKERLTPSLSKLAEQEGFELSLTKNDLPLLEKAFREGYEGEFNVHGYEGADDLGQVLRNVKLEWRQELVSAGHDFDRISRELNVSREFAETGNGEFALSRVEDHTKPLYAKVAYDTSAVPDKNYLRGVTDLMDRVKIAREHAAKTAAFILGPYYDQLPKTNGTLVGINTVPELNGFLRSASEDYSTTGQLFQQVGKVGDRAARERYGQRMLQISQWENKIRGDQGAQIELNMAVAKVRSYAEPLAVVSRQEGEMLLIPKRVLKEQEKEGFDINEVLNKLKEQDPKLITEIKNPSVQGYLLETQAINQERVKQWNAFFAAKGSTTSYDADAFYLPPVNTNKYPFVAFVRESTPTSLRPISVLTAQDAASLEAKVRKVRQEFGDVVEVYTKDNVEDFHKLKGDYERGLLLGNSSVDNSLAKKGILSDFAPRTDAVILDDFNTWHWKEERNLVRNATELQYAQEFAELRAMGEQFTEFQKSLYGQGDKRTQDNPYLRYVHTALNQSSNSKYDGIWGKFNSGVEALGQSMFKAWESVFGKATKGEIDWVAANKEAERMGFRPPYQDPLREIFNPIVQNSRVVEPIVAKANAAIATLVLRLDPLNAIVNILGTPGLIVSELAVIRRNITDPTVVGKLAENLSVAVPGTEHKLPSTLKLVTQAIKNFFTDDGTRLAYYREIGAVQSDLQLYKTAIDATSLTPRDLKDLTSIKGWANNVAARAGEVGAKLTGNNLSERMVRFLAADIMNQIAETAKLPAGEAAAYINTFVNRVHGNFVASQRPALFQGVVGQAISLFQTYQFNVMQNMLRYIERNEKMAVSALLGMQNTLFGMQGNPAFYLLNSYIGNSNRDHTDLSTSLYQTVGKDVGDWMLYGLGSNILHTNLYNRGDLTPRYVTVVPTNVLDSPAVSITAKAVGNLLDTVGTIAKGGSIPASILNGIAHNGFNRPLSGLAQLAQGYRTTKDGNLLVAYNDLDTMLIAAKVLGGEELNRAIAIDAFYRANAYKAKDKEKIADVGEALKTKLYKNQSPTEDETLGFMKEYARAGGRIETFNRYMLNNYKSANQSQINKMMGHMQTANGRNMATIMGGMAADDFYTNPTAPPETPPVQ